MSNRAVDVDIYVFRVKNIDESSHVVVNNTRCCFRMTRRPSVGQEIETGHRNATRYASTTLLHNTTRLP